MVVYVPPDNSYKPPEFNFGDFEIDYRPKARDKLTEASENSIIGRDGVHAGPDSSFLETREETRRREKGAQFQRALYYSDYNMRMQALIDKLAAIDPKAAEAASEVTSSIAIINSTIHYEVDTSLKEAIEKNNAYEGDKRDLLNELSYLSQNGATPEECATAAAAHEAFINRLNAGAGIISVNVDGTHYPVYRADNGQEYYKDKNGDNILVENTLTTARQRADGESYANEDPQAAQTLIDTQKHWFDLAKTNALAARTKELLDCGRRRRDAQQAECNKIKDLRESRDENLHELDQYKQEPRVADIIDEIKTTQHLENTKIDEALAADPVIGEIYREKICAKPALQCPREPAEKTGLAGIFTPHSDGTVIEVQAIENNTNSPAPANKNLTL